MRYTFTTILLLLSLAAHAAIGPVLAYWEPDAAQYMTRSGNGDPNDEPYTVLTTEAGRRCVLVPEGKYLYFRIDKSVVPSSMQQLIFRITYLDRGNGGLQFQYNGTNNDNYRSAWINKTGSDAWLTTTIAVTDASLRNAQNHGDIRINAGNYIARVEVCGGTMDPLSEPAITHLGGSSYSEFAGKSVAGYQAWFRVGGQRDFWHHWGNDAVAQDGTRWPRPYNHTFEIYPDISLYEDHDLYPTGFAALGNGDPARLYDGQSADVIAKHFDQMQQTGIQGVAVQRFLGNEMKSVTTNPAEKLLTIRREAERTGRIFYICYDITSNGLESTWKSLIEFDWVYTIEKSLELTQSPAYATVGGRPVVELWGIGFTDRPGGAQETRALVQWLQSRGCYVIGGVPTYWREQRNDAKDPSHGFMAVYEQCDMVSPWLVGRFSNTQEAQYFYGLQQGDIAYCRQHDMDYMPVLFAGFGWATWNSGSLNQAPRQAGAFLIDQAQHARQNGCTNLYFAMFDEYDEGTALLNAATDASMIPEDAYFLTYAADGRWLSADYYLRLAGAISDNLQISTFTNLHIYTFTNLQIPYSLGPVYYRNSFEQRDTRYNWQDGAYRSQGVFPVDPCLFEADGACSLVNHDARTGRWALQVNGVGQQKIATMRTEVTEPLVLTGYTRTPGAQLVLTLSDGTTLTSSTFKNLQISTFTNLQIPSSGWYELTLSVPASEIGKTITALSARATVSGVIYDDILLEKDENASTDNLQISTFTNLQIRKFLRSGRVWIERGGECYDVLGNVIYLPRQGLKGE